MKKTFLLMALACMLGILSCSDSGSTTTKEPYSGAKIKILGYADTSVYTEDQKKKYGDPSRDVAIVVFTTNDKYSEIGAITKAELSGKEFPIPGLWKNADVCGCGCDDMNIVTTINK